METLCLCVVIEEDLHKQVVQYLLHTMPRSCVLHHSPNEGIRHVAYKNKLKALGCRFGWPDLQIIVPGGASRTGHQMIIFIELKTKRGVLSSNQCEVRDDIMSAGCIWQLCRSLDDVIDFLRPLINFNVRL